MENEIKEQLSQTLNNALILDEHKSVEEKSDKNVIISSINNLESKLNKETEEVSCESAPARRRSGRQRKEKKLEDSIYYDSPSIVKENAKRRRGRPRKQEEVQETTEEVIPLHESKPLSNNNERTEEEETEGDEEETIIIKRGRRKKINLIESDEDNDANDADDGGDGDDGDDGDDDDDDDESPPPPKVKNNGSKQKSKIVECGVCNEKVPNSLWRYHCGKHNYLCWRVGEEPIELTNRKVCESILMKVALTKKVLFTCSKCGEKRKSAVGYLSHVDFCQKTKEERLAMRVPCPECHKLLQPYSLKIHMRNHTHELSFKSAAVVIAEEENSNADVVGKRSQRNAAKK